MKHKKSTVLTALFLAILLFCSGCKSSKPLVPEVVPTDIENFENIPLSYFGDLAAAAARAAQELQSKQALYIPAARYTVTGELTFNCPVKLAPGATFDIADGAKLTFANFFYAYDVRQRIFFGNGSVRIEDALHPGYADWVCDGSENDTEYIQKGINALRCLQLPKRTYSVGELVIASPTRIVSGGGMQVSLLVQGQVNRAITVRSSDVCLEDLLISMSNSQKSSCAVYLDTDVTALQNIKLLRVKFSRVFHGVMDAGNQKNGIDGIELNNVSFSGARDTQVIARDNWKNVRLIEVEVTRRTYGTGDNVNMPAYIFRNCRNMEIWNLDVNGDANMVGEVPDAWFQENLNGDGMEFTNCHGVVMNRCLVEYISGTGFRIKDCSGFRFEDVQSFTTHGSSFIIENLSDSQLNGIKGSPGSIKAAPADNIQMTGCKNVVIDGMMLRTNFKNGLTLQNNTNVHINNLSALYHVQEFAVLDRGGNQAVEIHGFTCPVLGQREDKAVISLTGSGVKLYAVTTAVGSEKQVIDQAGIYA